MLKNKAKKIVIFLVAITTIYNVFYLTQDTPRKLTGVYWGAFDPPTEAHAAIIISSMNDIPLKKLIVVVNNHAYKNYTYPLEMRLQMMKAIIQQHGLEKIELHWQDETHQINFIALKEISQEPLCAIAGYDAYKKWVSHSSSHDRSCYDAIAVIPRGEDVPILFDEIAFLLPIDSKYKDVSSTKVKAAKFLLINVK